MWDSLFLTGPLQGTPEVGIYNIWLVLLSYVIASLGAYVGLSLATDIRTQPRALMRHILHGMAALALGTGIWSMHFVGMLSYKMKMTVSYDAGLTALSIFIAVMFAYMAIWVTRSARLRFLPVATGGILLSLAVTGMHYTGMAAMEMDATLRYRPDLFALSVLIALAATMAALGIIYYLSNNHVESRKLWMMVAAAIMGFAVCGLHYTGMAAAIFLPFAECRYDPNQSFVGLALAVGGVSGLIFMAAIMLGAYMHPERRMSRRSVYSVPLFILCFGLAITLFGYAYIRDYNIKDSQAQTLMVTERFSTTATEYFQHIISSLQATQTFFDASEFVSEDEFRTYVSEILREFPEVSSIFFVPMRQSEAGANYSVLYAEPEFFGDMIGRNLTHLPAMRTGIETAQVLRTPFVGVFYNLLPPYDESAGQQIPVFLTVKGKDGTQSTLIINVDIKKFSEGISRRIPWIGDAPEIYERREESLGKAIHIEHVNLGGREAFVSYDSLDDKFRRDTQWMAPLVLLGGLLFSVIIAAYALTFLRQQRIDLQVQAQLRAEIAEKEELRHQADQASRAKSEFLANMSHEIRTPLNGIIGLTQLLEDSERDTERRKSLSVILRSSESLMLLLNDLLDISKIEAGELRLEEMPFNLNSVLQNVNDMLAPVAASKGISLTVSSDAVTIPSLIGDPTRIVQILANLVGNAVKFTEEGGVSVFATTDIIADSMIVRVVFTIHDSGIGIPEEARPQVFKKFTQADASMTRRFGGTGLGLAISKNLTELMGGTISFESRVGEGTVFTVTIPFLQSPTNVNPDARARTREQITVARREFVHKRVLLVDDHPVNMFFAIKLLRKMGFETICEVVNGMEAVKAVQDAPYDLILMDCQMPEMDGFEATRHIREWETQNAYKRVPIIAMTAHAMEGDRDLCLRAGMDDYISKPVSLDRLHNVLTYWLLGESQLEASPADAVQSYSQEQFEQFFDGDMEQELMLAGVFLKSGRQAIAEMQGHIDGNSDVQVWRIAAHRLKGSSAQMGAESLSALCRMAEAALCEGPAEKQLMLQKITQDFDEVIKYFRARHDGKLG